VNPFGLLDTTALYTLSHALHLAWMEAEAESEAFVPSREVAHIERLLKQVNGLIDSRRYDCDCSLGH